MANKKKYRRTWPKRAKVLAAKGCILQDIAREFGVCPETLKKYRDEYPELEKAISEGTREANHAVESALFRRAIGYEFEEVTTEVYDDQGSKRKHIKKTVKHIAPDTRAAELWLMNKNPEQWRKRKQVEHSGKIKTEGNVGAPVLIFSDMTPENEPELSDYLNNNENEGKENETS